LLLYYIFSVMFILHLKFSNKPWPMLCFLFINPTVSSVLHLLVFHHSVSELSIHQLIITPFDVSQEYEDSLLSFHVIYYLHAKISSVLYFYCSFLYLIKEKWLIKRFRSGGSWFKASPGKILWDPHINQ
jgi:hypothetical protein